MYDPNDFEAQSPSPTSGREASDLKRQAALILCMSLLSHDDPEAQADQPGAAAALAPVLPGFWLTLSQAAAALAQENQSDPEICQVMIDQAVGLLNKAVQRAPADPHVLHTAGSILKDLAALGAVERDEEREIYEHACLYLAEAARIAPTRPDILNDLGNALATRAEALEGPERIALLQEATRRFDEAACCFNAANLRFPETGSLHPYYTLALACAGAVRWALADLSEEEEERRTLLREGYRQLQEASRELEDKPPDRLLILGRAALDLAWLPGNREARRELFDEACSHLAAAAGVDDLDVYPFWGSATVGRAALSHGADRRELLVQAEELFLEGARRNPGTSEPDRAAAYAWLRLAAESSAEEAQDAARRAAEAARRANRIQPGSGDYNLACALSRMGQPSEAAEALTAALAHDPEAMRQALYDPDLELLWEARPKLRQAIAAGRLSPGSTPP